MNQSFYIGAIGAQQQQRRMNVQSNNIANVNTYGYRADAARFEALLYDSVRSIDEGDLNTGLGTRIMMTSTNFGSTGLAPTSRAQDYAIEGDGFFALVDLATGELSYTRNGAFEMAEYRPSEDLDPVYCLSDGNGRFVLNQQGQMIVMQDDNEPQAVGIFDFDNYDGIIHLNDTRFIPVEKNGQVRAGTGKVISGMLEMSNVDLADELTKVIESQRAYGIALKMVQTSDEIETTINQLRR